MPCPLREEKFNYRAHKMAILRTILSQPGPFLGDLGSHNDDAAKVNAGFSVK
jgi:hypothetical protein